VLCVRAPVREFAVTAIGWPPLFGDREDRGDLVGQQAMHRSAARCAVHQCAHLAPAGPPPMHPIIGHLPQRAHPPMREPLGAGVVDGLEDKLFDFGGDPRRERSDQPQPAFPRTTANSIAWALIASVSWPISARAASSWKSRSLACRPGVRANAVYAASFTVLRIPMIVDTSTTHLRAASAWVISPEVTCKKISHFVSGDNLFAARRPFVSLIERSSQNIREGSQAWVDSRWTLRAEVRRKTMDSSRFRVMLGLSGLVWVDGRRG